MDLTLRRIAYSVAIAIFFVVAPIVLAITYGYRWTGLGTGFIRTGVIVVQSDPKASISINDQARGQTPKRIVGLEPGTYEITLTREGHQPWSRFVRVRANTATVIGPVNIFPEDFSLDIIARDVPAVVTDVATGRIFALRSGQTESTIQQIWPTVEAAAWTIAFRPTSLSVSTRGRFILAQSPTQSSIIDTERPETPWAVQNILNPQWDSSAAAVLFGIRDNALIRLDALTQSETLIDQASSFTIANDQLWYAHISDHETTVFQRPALGQQSAQVIEVLDGSFAFLPNPNDILIRDQLSHAAALWQFSTLTQHVTQLPLGRVDQYFIDQPNRPLIWLDGVDLLTRLNQQTKLIERSPDNWTWVSWIDPSHILLSATTTQVAIRSVSTRQGYETLLTRSLSGSQTVQYVDTPNEELLVYDQAAGVLLRWSWEQ